MNPLRQKVLPACAKINLCLDVLRRRPDGYHELDTIFQRLALHDTLVLTHAAKLTVAGDRAELPLGAKNIAYRAAELLQGEYGVDLGAAIYIRKRIPIAAGLGGGSADAAAVLRGLPALWGLPPLPRERLLALAGMLGADVPFCLAGITARAGGVGEKLRPLPPFDGYEVLLVKPQAWLSTASVYGRLDLGAAAHPDTEAAAAAMRARDLAGLAAATGNVLAPPAADMMPEILSVQEALRLTGAPLVLMSGSGPTVFALGGERGWSRRAAAAVARPGWTVIRTRTY